MFNESNLTVECSINVTWLAYLGTKIILIYLWLKLKAKEVDADLKKNRIQCRADNTTLIYHTIYSALIFCCLPFFSASCSTCTEYNGEIVGKQAVLFSFAGCSK